MHDMNVNYYLIDGDVQGRIKCTYLNWTGVAYRIPRTEIEKCNDLEELNQSGVYLLFGVDDYTGKNVVYIGQAGTRGILNRLRDHIKDKSKEYWNEAIIFTSSNNILGQTDICYLENILFNLALDAKRYEAKNDNEPPKGNTIKEKESDLNVFIEYVKVMVGILGHNVFEPYAEISCNDINSNETAEEILHYTTRTGDFEGKGQRTNDGFVVFKGSKIKPNVAESCPRSAITAREHFSYALDSNYVLREDVLLSSPSCAASFLSGISVNGKDVWVNEKGESLNIIEARCE